MPIFVGGHSEAAARRAGRLGDGFFPATGAQVDIEPLIELARETAAAFGRASRGPEQRLKALEMQGSCLRRSGRNGEALAAFQDGLNTEGQPARHFLGLIYEVGICYEEMGNPKAARKAFERAAAIDAGFRDVAERLQRLVTPAS